MAYVRRVGRLRVCLARRKSRSRNLGWLSRSLFIGNISTELTISKLRSHIPTELKIMIVYATLLRKSIREERTFHT